MNPDVNLSLQTVVVILILIGTFVMKGWTVVTQTLVAEPKTVTETKISPFRVLDVPIPTAGQPLDFKLSTVECQKKTQTYMYAGIGMILVGYLFAWLEVSEGAKIHPMVSGIMSLATFIGNVLVILACWTWSHEATDACVTGTVATPAASTDTSKKGMALYVVFPAAIIGLLLSFAEAYDFVENMSTKGRAKFAFEF